MARWKQLKGIANSAAHQFNASREYFDIMMRENRIDEVRIDMLSETVEPELFNIPRNMNLIHLCAANLQRLIAEQYGQPVESATLNLTQWIQNWCSSPQTEEPCRASAQKAELSCRHKRHSDPVSQIAQTS